MTKPFKIFISILLSMILLLVLFFGMISVGTRLTTNRLRAVAYELPQFSGKSLAEGERGNRECYISRDKMNCPSLTIKLPLSEDAGWKSADAFIEASKNLGVKWSDTDTKRFTYIKSDAFERDSKKYSVWIDKAGDEFWVSVVEY